MLTAYKPLFGNEVAELCLLYIVNYGEGHARGIASTFGVFVRSVQLQLEKLELAGVLVSKFTGNVKLFKINPRLAYKNELTALIEKMLAIMPEETTDQYFRQRRRPRRTGKRL